MAWVLQKIVRLNEHLASHKLAPTNENVSFNPGILAEARKYKTLISSLG
jgi:hypothetical protein